MVDDRNYQITYPDGGTERRWYDATGNLIKVCRPEQYDSTCDEGQGYTYEYDSMNRLVQVTAPDGTVRKRYEYDLCGNIIEVRNPQGMEGRELFVYNHAGKFPGESLLLPSSR